MGEISSESMSRRDWLKIAGAGFLFASETGDHSSNKKIPKEVEPKNIEITRKERISPEPRKCKTVPPMTGARFGTDGRNLYARYTGIYSDAVPEEVTVNFSEQLEKMWGIKATRKTKKGKNLPITPVAVQTGEELVDEYDGYEPTFMDVENYSKHAENCIREVNLNINWEQVRKHEHLMPEELTVLQEIPKKVNGRDMLAYGLTELMPAQDGKLNIAVLDFLLKNAGREYVESIPAMFDKYTSFGLYQFTQFALFAGKRRDKKGRMLDVRDGASIINACLPSANRIPDSVSKLRGDDHHKAAYLFVLDNFANLIRGMSWEQLDNFNKLSKKDPDSLVVFMATAHHGPVQARSAVRRWVDDGGANPIEHYFYVEKTEFIKEPGKKKATKIKKMVQLEQYKAYARKTRSNLEALKSVA